MIKLACALAGMGLGSLALVDGTGAEWERYTAMAAIFISVVFIITKVVPELVKIIPQAMQQRQRETDSFVQTLIAINERHAVNTEAIAKQHVETIKDERKENHNLIRELTERNERSMSEMAQLQKQTTETLISLAKLIERCQIHTTRKDG